MTSSLVHCKSLEAGEALCYLLATQGCHGIPLNRAGWLVPFPFLVLEFDSEQDVNDLLCAMTDFVINATKHDGPVPHPMMTAQQVIRQYEQDGMEPDSLAGELGRRVS